MKVSLVTGSEKKEEKKVSQRCVCVCVCGVWCVWCGVCVCVVCGVCVVWCVCGVTSFSFFFLLSVFLSL